VISSAIPKAATSANVSQVQRELQRATPGQPVFLLMWRDGESVFVTLRKR
jgi:hypothetical protein